MTRPLLAIALLSITVSCRDVGPRRGPPGIVIQVKHRTDTCGTWSRLVVSVFDSTGVVATGAVVRFGPLLSNGTDNAEAPWVSKTDMSLSTGFVPYFSVLVDTTDASGVAEMWVRTGYRTAKVGLLGVSVPQMGFLDTASYASSPGNATHVTATPADTAAFVGNSYAVKGTVRDQSQNPRTDAVTYSVVSGPATINPTTGLATPTAIGRATILVKHLDLVDTVALSVVPPGAFAANGTHVYRMQFDGSQFTQVALSPDIGAPSRTYAWSPDGKSLAAIRGDGHYIRLIAPGDSEHTVLQTTRDLYESLRFSPDGQWIYFAMSVPNSSGSRLFRIHTDGSDLDSLGNVVDSQGYPSPTFDTASIAYVSSRNCGQNQCIRIMDLATRTDKTINGADWLASGGFVSASPTDDLIVYTVSNQIVISKADGTSKRILAQGNISVAWIDWSPDGKWLLVSASEGGPPPELINVATGDRLPLGYAVGMGHAAWQP